MLQSLDYSNIDLIPDTISNIDSRDDIDISAKIGDIRIDIPLIAPPMVDVVDSEVAKKIYEAGGYSILHRFSSIDEQTKSYLQSPPDVACAIGISKEEQKRYNQLYDNGCRIFCVDVANGASERVGKFISQLDLPDTQIIAGNVASYKGYKFLAEMKNVVAVRVGIAFGAGCTTKNATGCCSPMASTLAEMSKGRHYKCLSKKAKVIADGGIREPQDMCKALALGANITMAGSIIAACVDSPAKTRTDHNGQVYKIYSGSASSKIQSIYREEPKYVEGTTRELTCNGLKIKELVRQYGEGLRSSMSYFGARSIKQFQKSAQFSVRY